MVRSPFAFKFSALVWATLVFASQANLSAQTYQWTTIAGAPGDAGVGSTDGPVSTARFKSPYGIAVDAAGTLYVSEIGNHTIRKITQAGSVSTLAGQAGLSAHVDGTGSAARFWGPRGLTVDRDGNVFVADTINEVIRKVSPTGVVTTVAGTPGVRGWVDGPASGAQFFSPTGVALDRSGNVYVSDLGSGAIRKISTAGVVTTHVAYLATIDGAGYTPLYSIAAADDAGAFYVGEFKIRHVAANGTVTTFAGSLLQSFMMPSGLTVDRSGAVFFVEQTKETIVRVANGDVSTIAGLAFTPGTTDGNGIVARFSRPSGIAVDLAGNLYVTDQANNTIRKGVQLGRPVLAVTSENRFVAAGQSVTFSALVGGGPTPTLQWFRDGTPIPGATSATLTIAAVQAADTGSYSVVATNSIGTTSATAGSLVVVLAPAITAQPQAAVLTGTTGATLTVTAAGFGPFTYQWLRDGQPIAGATGTAYIPTTPGNYSVIVSNSGGTTTSAVAAVTVAPSGRLINIATRGAVSGTDGLVAGFVVAPGAPSKQLLIRGIGPTLGAFGVPGTLARPLLTVFRGSTVAFTNSGWGGATSIEAAGRAVGAFPLSGGSADAAVLVDLEPGSYTVQLEGLNAEAGATLVEVYETQASAARLINLSTRGRVTTSENLTAGIVIGGGGEIRLLIRAIGPGLGQFGLTGFLARPRLTVFRADTVIATNEGWSAASNAAEIPVAATSVGAFTLINGSADAVALLSLAPGNYTAQISGVAGATGIALVEVYQLP